MNQPATALEIKDHEALSLLKRMTDISVSISSQPNVDLLLEHILLEAKSIANADGGTLYFRTNDETLEFKIVRNDTLNIAYGGSTGITPPMPPLHVYVPNTKRPEFSIQAVFALFKQKPVNIQDAYEAGGFDFEGTKRFDSANNYRTISVLTVPMVNQKGQSLGCLQLVNAKDPGTGKVVPFSNDIQQIVHALASQAAILLDNAQLIESQKKLLESVIEMIAKAIDAKSPYTGEHCERVPVLTEMLAAAGCRDKSGIFENFDLTEEEKYELHIAAWLHDCGKITTPVHIMDKATKLETIYDRIELVRARFELMKRDAELKSLRQIAEEPQNKHAIEAALASEIAQLDDDMAFIEKANIGGEFMADAMIDRLKAIGSRTFSYHGTTIPVLSENELYNLSIRRGTINTEERKIMNDHMVVTLDMLNALPFPKHLRRVPEYAGGHHERMDGKGYPKGIPAGTMSIPARMMAVADVFEALTASDRPYKPAKKLSEAMKIISNMKRDHHLDPDIVDLFVRSKVYLQYAEKYLAPELLDYVDEHEILNNRPERLL